MKAEGGRLEVAVTIQYLPPLFVSDRQARVGWSASAMVWSARCHARDQVNLRRFLDSHQNNFHHSSQHNNIQSSL
jgi:hypothetical protein